MAATDLDQVVNDIAGAAFGSAGENRAEHVQLGEANTIDLGERELGLMRTLRNQAVMAFKQAT